MVYLLAAVLVVAGGVIAIGLWNDSARWINRAREDMSPDQEKDKSDS